MNYNYIADLELFERCEEVYGRKRIMMRNRIFNLIRKEKKMTRYEKMLLLSKMIGRKNLSKLQSILKYEISFRKIYKSKEL